MTQLTSKDSLTLKWGTLKAWRLSSDKAQELLDEYGKLGMSFGAAQQKDTPRQKEIICELIDECNGEIWLDWDGKKVTKAEAKDYVMDYGREKKSTPSLKDKTKRLS